MAKGIHNLTVKQVEHARPGKLYDGGGLMLVTSSNGSSRWAFLFRQPGGKRREMGLGKAGPGGVSLASARASAARAREVIAAGGDPIEQRKLFVKSTVSAGTTFGDAADSYIADQKDGWSNEKHSAQWSYTLGDAYCSSLRPKPISTIGVEDVVSVLRPVWQIKPETARRLRMRIERVLDAARVRGLRDGPNPATWKGNLEHLLPKQKDRPRHHAALPWRDVPKFFDLLEERDGISALAFQFLILTAARTGEVIGARWIEFDLEAEVWEIPAERMKSRRPHRVPLTMQSIKVLSHLIGLSDEWVFPTKRDTGPISNMALLTLLKRMKRTDITAHGFRSTFRDWVAEATSTPGEVAEMALAHTIRNATEAAYRRGDLFDRRRILMEQWASFCSPRDCDDETVVTLVR